MPEIIVDQYGAFIGKHSERLRISVKGKLIEERPLIDVDHVLIMTGGVSLSSDVVHECVERGIDISFLTFTGAPYARLVAPTLGGTVQTRRQQLLAYTDGRGVELAKAFAAGKLANQANLLRYMAKNRRQSSPEIYEQARDAALEVQAYADRVRALRAERIDDVRSELLSLEAHAARAYWEAARSLLLPDAGWESRETRGATDLVNSALNYGYGVLLSHVERAVLLAGLDPYAGFLHADRSGKPSLVLDLIEEFRQMVVDRTVFGLLNLGVRLEAQDGRLSDETRRTLAKRVNERLDGEAQYRGKRQKLRAILAAQARRIATFVRGESSYEPWVGSW